MVNEFKEGDKVKLLGTKTGVGDSDWKEVVEKFNCKKGDIVTLGKEYSATNYYIKEFDSDSYTPNFSTNDFEVVKKGKVKPEDLIRYMVYGQGCDNTSKLFETEKELKEETKKVSHDTSWTGRIIGYKLTPIFEAENKVILKTIKVSKKRK